MSTQEWLEKDFYKALGVAKDADAPTIKKSYRKLARQLHPDKNPGDAKSEARFKDVSEAYDVLSDPAKRKEYDEARALFGSGGFRRGANNGFPGGGNTGFPGGAGGFDLGDLFAQAGQGGGADDLGGMFGNLFGGNTAGSRTRGRGTTGPRRGQDVEAEVTLDFDEATRGTTLPLQLTGPAACSLCHGSGAKPGTTPHTCPTCGGGGFVSRNQGAFGFSEPCRDCKGTGQIIDDPCPQCGGTGQESRTRTITVKIPTGVREGARLRIPGKGTPGARSGPSGDLYVVVHVRPDDLFGRQGDDLTLAVPISFAEAALGTTLRVPTLDGAVSLKVPPGTSSGRTLRVRGRGVTTSRGGHGDLLVTVEVDVPTALDPAAKQAVEALASALPVDPRPRVTAALASRTAGTAGTARP